jgi:microcystin-dependent protein
MNAIWSLLLGGLALVLIEPRSLAAAKKPGPAPAINAPAAAGTAGGAPDVPVSDTPKPGASEASATKPNLASFLAAVALQRAGTTIADGIAGSCDGTKKCVLGRLQDYSPAAPRGRTIDHALGEIEQAVALQVSEIKDIPAKACAAPAAATTQRHLESVLARANLFAQSNLYEAQIKSGTVPAAAASTQSTAALSGAFPHANALLAGVDLGVGTLVSIVGRFAATVERGEPGSSGLEQADVEAVVTGALLSKGNVVTPDGMYKPDLFDRLDAIRKSMVINQGAVSARRKSLGKSNGSSDCTSALQQIDDADTQLKAALGKIDQLGGVGVSSPTTYEPKIGLALAAMNRSYQVYRASQAESEKGKSRPSLVFLLDVALGANVASAGTYTTWAKSQLLLMQASVLVRYQVTGIADNKVYGSGLVAVFCQSTESQKSAAGYQEDFPGDGAATGTEAVKHCVIQPGPLPPLQPSPPQPAPAAKSSG